MAKLKVKLNEKLDKSGKGFYDMETGKRIAPENFGKGEIFEAEDSALVQEKISSRELILIEQDAEAEKKETEKKEAEKKDAKK